MEISFSGLVISAIVVLSALTGMIVFMGDVVNSYPATANPSAEGVELSEYAQSISEQLGVTEEAQFDVNPSIFSTILDISFMGWTAITTMIMMPFTLTAAMGHALSTLPFVPAWVGGMLSAVIMATFIFFVIYIVFKVRG